LRKHSITIHDAHCKCRDSVDWSYPVLYGFTMSHQKYNLREKHGPEEAKVGKVA